MVPSFIRLALLPVMVTATVLPLTVSEPVEVTYPVWPLLLPSVCGVVEEASTTKTLGDGRRVDEAADKQRYKGRTRGHPTPWPPEQVHGVRDRVYWL